MTIEEEDVSNCQPEPHDIERDELPAVTLQLELGDESHRHDSGDDPTAGPDSEHHGPADGEGRDEGKDQLESSQSQPRLRTAWT